MGVITNYLWDEFSTYGDVILETDAAGLELTRYTLGNGQLISEPSNPATLAMVWLPRTSETSGERAEG
ncbi:MAG: hypothetical protein KC708_11855 [Anaerolineae bacterium]|nr:hypothetical protein [Anaerolineae bacterium]